MREAFIDAMRAAPDDAATALVFADWLDENGNADRAAFIRAQCCGEATDSRKAALCRRIGVPADYDFAVEMSFSRGFLDELSIPAAWLVEGAAALADEPLLRKLTVGRVNGWGERLAALPLLGSVRELEVEAWIDPFDAQVIAVSPYLSHLRSLVIWLGNREGSETIRVLRFTDGVKRNYTKLEDLLLVGIPGVDARTIADLNQLAGREVVKAVIPLPRLYPIAADFNGLFAGHLPDGSQVLVEPPDNGPAFRLFLFTPAGEQIEVRELDFPPDAADFDDYLGRWLNLTPGLIHVLGIDDPDGLYSIEPDAGDTETYGVPDDPDLRPEDDPHPDNAMGNASSAAYWLKYGAYVFHAGNPWYVGPDGEVEST